MKQTVFAFESAAHEIATPKHHLSSKEVLEKFAGFLEELNYNVERGKFRSQKIDRPVLYGRNGAIDKAIEVDAWQESTGTIAEVEIG